ncbi:MAG: diguanylate cyclase [Candidatus Omnitrophica bacterium]|nr:diguanylate cyclase [Candidatus Omnitrophota bacterium]
MNIAEDLLAQLIHQCPLPVVLTDTQGKIHYVNREFCQRSGYSKEELIGENPRLLKSGITPPEVHQHLWETILSGNVWQGDLTNCRKNGEIYVESITITPIKDSEGKTLYFMGVWQDVTERKWVEDEWVKRACEYEKLSRIDDLTGLYNHGHILLELAKEVERSERYHRPLAAMMIDIDNFKQVNDTYGHLTGDRVLKTYASVIRKSIRRVDIAGRFGGDEFLVILPESTDTIAALVARRILENVQLYNKDVFGDTVEVTASIGLLAKNPSNQEGADQFIEKIDQVLYRAKQAGKNRIVQGED